jgi:putative flippase GtrA
MRHLRGEAMRFALVGAAATAVHATAGVVLLHAGIAPLAATALAFLLAFQVSLQGHRRWTFRDRAVPGARTAPRFALVALAGLGANALLLSVLARLVRPDIALPAACLIVAAMTFALSRAWVFATIRPAKGKTP